MAALASCPLSDPESHLSVSDSISIRSAMRPAPQRARAHTRPTPKSPQPAQARGCTRNPAQQRPKTWCGAPGHEQPHPPRQRWLRETRSAVAGGASRAVGPGAAQRSLAPRPAAPARAQPRLWTRPRTHRGRARGAHIAGSSGMSALTEGRSQAAESRSAGCGRRVAHDGNRSRDLHTHGVGRHVSGAAEKLGPCLTPRPPITHITPRCPFSSGGSPALPSSPGRM